MLEMDQLLVLGNGFDLACGLKSSYSDFFYWRYEELNINIENFSEKLNEFIEFTNLNNRKRRSNINIPLKVFSEFKKKFDNLTDWDIFFLVDRYFKTKSIGIESYNWCDIESLIKKVLLGLSSDKYPYDDCADFEGFINNYTVNVDWDEYLRELHIIEKSFSTYLKTLDDTCDYDSRAMRKIDFLINKEDIEKKEHIDIFSFNYTLNDFMVFHKEGIVRSFSNIHGDDKHNNSIFGIDSTDVDVFSPFYRFTKTYRILFENINEKRSQKLDEKVGLITFYGHSLAKADYSYFEAMFDRYNIYNSDVTLEFYCSLYENEIDHRNIELKKSFYKSIIDLVSSYGSTLNNNHGAHLLHRLIIENRLRVNYDYNREEVG